MRKIARTLWLPALVAIAAPLSAIAQEEDDVTPEPGSMQLGEVSEPIEPEAKPEVESIPQRVGVPATKVEIDPAIIGVVPGEPMPALLREGQFIVNRPAKLVRLEEHGLMLVVFDAREGQEKADPPMIVQACSTLETTESLLERRGSDTPLLVSGQVNTYRGFNYLLPTMLAPAPTKAKQPPAPAAEPEPTVEQEAPTPAQQPAAAEAPAEQNDVMAELLALRETTAEPAQEAPSETESLDLNRPLIEHLKGLDDAVATVQIDKTVLGIAPDRDAPALRREGEFIVSRSGRLVRGTTEGRTLLFVLEADSSDAQELPIILQPCRLLESMENIVQQRGDAVKFVVSGQLHTYNGANYLLPTMMKLAIEKGNLLN